jgi:hypothetical protein
MRSSGIQSRVNCPSLSTFAHLDFFGTVTKALHTSTLNRRPDARVQVCLFKQPARFRHAELHFNASACRKADGSTVSGAHFNYFAQGLCELNGPARWNYATNTSNDSACVSSVGDHARECHGHRLAENKGKCFVNRTQAEHIHRRIKTLHLPPLSKQHAPAFELSLSHQPHQKIVPVIDSPTNEHESDQGISQRDDCSSP